MPLPDRSYRRIDDGVFVDTAFETFRPGMIDVVKAQGGGWVSTDATVPIRGISYEMSLAMCKRGGVYSGMVVAYENGVCEFGPVRGMGMKRASYPQLITSTEVPAFDVTGHS